MTEDNNDFDYNRVFTNDDGSGVFSLRFGDAEMASSFKSKATSLQTEAKSEGAYVTPDGDSDEKRRVSDEVGAVKRANEYRTYLGSVGLEALALDNYEVSKAINRASDEIFRDDFPILRPKEEDADETQKERIQRRFTSVNDAGQSLHGLLKMVAQDHARLGTGMLIVRKRYLPSFDAEDGVTINEATQALERGDPKVVRPVTDAKNRLGGLYACPIHRMETLSDEEGGCPKCVCEKREVTYAKTENPRVEDIEAVYFDDEVISFSFYNTRLHGRDGISPVAGIWKQAHILEQMRNYVGQYFDDDTGNRYPNTLMFIKTSNADAFEKQAQQAKDSRQENAYEQGIIMAEDMDLEVEVVDMMSSEIIGQSEAIKDRFESQIRSQFGLTDVIDSEEESASLASGSKGLDAMSRSIQAVRTDLEREVLPEIEEAFSIDEWELTFSDENTEDEQVTITEKAEAIQRLAKAGQSYRIEGGDVVLVDSDEEIDEDSDETEDVLGSEEDEDNDKTDVSV